MIRATAFEPRISRAVAFDILDDCQLGNIGAVGRPIESWLDLTESVLDRDAATRTPAAVRS